MSRHHSILLSKVGASVEPGAVHLRIWVHVTRAVTAAVVRVTAGFEQLATQGGYRERLVLRCRKRQGWSLGYRRRGG